MFTVIYGMAWGETGSSIERVYHAYCSNWCGANSSNIEITFYSDNYGGKGNNKFIIAAYLHVVTNVQIHSVAYKYVDVSHKHNEGDSCYFFVEINIKNLYSLVR